jgi:hypothetical protein
MMIGYYNLREPISGKADLGPGTHPRIQAIDALNLGAAFASATVATAVSKRSWSSVLADHFREVRIYG